MQVFLTILAEFRELHNLEKTRMCTKHLAVLFRLQFLRICRRSMRSLSARFMVSVTFHIIYVNAPVADPGFARGGANLSPPP